MQRNTGVKRAHIRLHGVVRFAEFRVGGHGFQVPHHRHGLIQRFGGGVERHQGVIETARFGIGRQPVDALARLAQQLGYGRLDMLGADLVEGDSKG